MDTRTGEITQISPELMEELKKLAGVDKEKLLKEKYLVEIKRDLTEKEKSEMRIRLYSPCGCGSGRKFKFCCKR